MSRLFPDAGSPVFRALSSRVALNLYAILFFGTLSYFFQFTFEPEKPLGKRVFEAVILILANCLLIYTNALVLILLVLRRGKYLLYMVLFILLVLVGGLLNQWVENHVHDHRVPHRLTPQIVSTLLILLSFGSIKFYADGLRAQQKHEALHKKQLETELKLLKAQLNPHFLFNTLNNLYGLSVKKSDQLPALMLRLSDLLRYMLYEANEPQVPLEKEVRYLESYVALERIRLGSHVRIDYQESGDFTIAAIAPMLLITFVENCFKHGQAAMHPNGTIRIAIHQAENGVLAFEVENPKVTAWALAGPLPSGGIGLSNVQKRLQMLYPQRHTLIIDEAGNTFKVRLTIYLA